MIVVKCNKRNASTLSIETLTVGSAGIEVKFEFTPDWDGVNKAPCFCAGDIANPTEVRRAELTADNTCVIPSEVLRKAGQTAWAGVYGFTSDGEIITPTIWASLGTVKNGATADADPSADPTLPIWAQIEAKIGDLADLDTVAKDTLVNAINEVAQSGGGGSANIEMRVSGGYIQYTSDGHTWRNVIAVSELKGAKGDKGDPGENGRDGADGAKGDKGDDGAPGAKGDKGDKGDTGATGPAGPTGPQGPAYTLTDADKQTIVQAVLAALPDGDEVSY